MLGIIITVIVIVAVVDTLFNKEKTTPPTSDQVEVVAEKITSEVQPDIVDEKKLVDELLISLADMTSFLNVMVGKKIFRLEQIEDDVVRVQECLRGLTGQTRYSNARLQNGTLYTVSNDMLWNEK